MNTFVRITADTAPQQSRASVWHVPALEALAGQLEAESNRTYTGPNATDEQLEYYNELCAAREAAEELDIRLSNAGWLPTFKGAL